MKVGHPIKNISRYLLLEPTRDLSTRMRLEMAISDS